MKKRVKRGQVSVFVIAGIAITGIVLMFLFFKIGIIQDTGRGKDIEPNSFMASCLETKVHDATDLIASQGGYVGNPLNISFKFSDESRTSDIAYLCYTQSYYVTCVNQEPVLMSHLKSEIKNYISQDVQECFDELVFSLEKKGNVVDSRYDGFEVKFMPKRIIIEGDSELVLTKDGETSKQEDFKVSVPSKFYDLAVVVQEIASQEARFCNFENLGFMLFYPEFNIDRFKTGDSTTIYTVEDRDSQEKFKFAIRGCVIPPGI